MENIMVRPDKSVKLIDFGYSEILPRPSNKIVKFCGTPYYMPPEFIMNKYFNGKFFFLNKK
jgi:serine/threonine protein kinase